MGAFVEFLKNDKNNLSYWFPKVKDCGIRVPETHIVPVPEELLGAFFLENKGDKEKIAEFVRKDIMPVIEKMDGLPFIKNGTSSNKFDFSKNCAPVNKDFETILHSIISIQYDSLCVDKGGNLEFAIRERIDSPGVPTIYNGMPLNTEFRVFYDFDNHRLLYIVNYWDWDYCHESIEMHIADGKTFNDNRKRLETDYSDFVHQVWNIVDVAMKKNDRLTGIWSIDILMDFRGRFWLIDMAEANKSVYWDQTKAILCSVADKTMDFIKMRTRFPLDERELAELENSYLEYSRKGTSYYQCKIQNEVLYTYVHSKWGHKEYGGDLDGEHAEYFGHLDFIKREMDIDPEEKERFFAYERQLREVFDTDDKNNVQVIENAETKKKAAWSDWSALTDLGFAVALKNFLEKKVFPKQ